MASKSRQGNFLGFNYSYILNAKGVTRNYVRVELTNPILLAGAVFGRYAILSINFRRIG